MASFLVVHGLNLHPVLLNAFTDEVISYIDVFAAVVEHWVSAEHDGVLIVDLQVDGTGLLASEFCK